MIVTAVLLVAFVALLAALMYAGFLLNRQAHEFTKLQSSEHKQAMEQSRQVVNTLDQLLRMTNDRCLNISDGHLQAKRDEWEGRMAVIPRNNAKVVIPDSPPEDEKRVVWQPEVDALELNGQSG